MRRIALGLLCGIAFCIPWEELAVLPGLSTVIFALGALTVVVAAFVALRRKLDLPPVAFSILGIYTAYCYLSVLWAPNTEMAWHYSFTNIQLLVLTAMFWQFGRGEGRVDWILRAYLLGCTVTLINLGYNWMQGVSTEMYETRFQGGGLNENDLATVLDISLPMAIYLARKHKPLSIKRAPYYVYAMATALGVLLTGSRAGTLGLFTGIAMTSLAFALKGPMPFATVVGVAGGGATLVYSLVPKDIFKRLAEGTQADTFQIRMRLWKAGLQYFTEHPFIGSGVGNFRAAVSPRIAETIVAHNTFIELLAEEGIIGFTIMCAFWLMLGRMVYLMRREDRLFWATVFLVWAVCVSTLSWEFNKSTWFIYACLMAHFSTIQTRKQRAELAKAKAAA